MSTEGFVSMSKHFQEAHDPGLHDAASHDDISVDIDIPEEGAGNLRSVTAEASAPNDEAHESQPVTELANEKEPRPFSQMLVSVEPAAAAEGLSHSEPTAALATAGDISAHPALSAIDPQILQAIRDERADKVRAINRQLAVSILGTVSGPISAGDLEALVSYATGDEVSIADISEILDGAVTDGSHLLLVDGRYTRLSFTPETTRALILEQFRPAGDEPDDDWPSYQVLFNQVFNETDAPQDEQIKAVLDQTIKSAIQDLVERAELAQIAFEGKVFLHPVKVGRMIDLDGEGMPIDVNTGERV